MKKNILPGLPGFSPRVGAMTANERRLGRYIRDGEGHPGIRAGDGPPLRLDGLNTKQFTDALEKQFNAIEKKMGGLPSEVAGLKAQLVELAQKQGRAEHYGGGIDIQPSWGSQFVYGREQDLEDVKDNRNARLSLKIKATITSATADAAGSAGSLMTPHRDQLLGLPKRRLTIRDLLNVVRIESGSVEYPKQTLRTNNAGMVAEGAAKPQSDLQWALQNVPIRTIAHWVKASRQILSDVTQLRSEIDSELIYGLALVEEAQLLSGDGTGQNLSGMIPQATAYSAPMAIADLNMMDIIGLAICQLALADHLPDGVLLHPSDWWYMRTMKDGMGRYIFGNPGEVVVPSLFGLPVVTTKAMTARKFMVGNFKAQTLYDREEARVEVGFVNDDFTKNLVTILGEERVGFAAKRPDALVYGDFDAAMSA